MPMLVACIVEGHGEVAAVPVLLRRIAEIVVPHEQIQVGPCLRVPRSSLVKQGEVERAVELATRKTGEQGAVLVLIDSNGDCPAKLGPELLARARRQRADMSIAVVLAKREYEAWFLAAAESLRGQRGLPDDLQPPRDPESVQGAKEWLRARMPADRKYGAVLDQPALTAAFDMDAARRADSFDKCYREVERLLGELYQRAMREREKEN